MDDDVFCSLVWGLWNRRRWTRRPLPLRVKRGGETVGLVSRDFSTASVRLGPLLLLLPSPPGQRDVLFLISRVSERRPRFCILSPCFHLCACVCDSDTYHPTSLYDVPPCIQIRITSRFCSRHVCVRSSNE